MAAGIGQGPEKGKINRVCTIKRGVRPLPIEKFTDGEMYRFVYQYDEVGEYSGSTVHRYAGVGSAGKFYSRAKIDELWPTLGRIKDLSATERAVGDKKGNGVMMARRCTANGRGGKADKRSKRKREVEERCEEAESGVDKA